MTRTQPSLIAALALTVAAALPAWAASSASSAVSDSVSDSVGSVSTSFQKSSNASSGGEKTAAGDYKVVEVADAAAQPGAVRLKLQAVARPGADGELLLTLPRTTAEQAGIAVGQVVSARPRAFGVEFAQAIDGKPFFLVLDDDAYRELQTRVVKL